MATPAIQTLLTDAQQVLNLNSLSEVRATMAAALANANVGTPLSPNLTTQQLWDEFYLIVRQPESDIESIITNQLMKFLFAPPAPGGVGADGQVIFNDGGVLAGDPQFLWNKTTNLLTVTGSATITGDLTVDTSTLKVDTTNNRVGIGTASPAFLVDAQQSSTGAVYGSVANNDTSGTGSARFRLFNSGDVADGFALINNYGASGQVNILNYKASSLALWTNSSQRYQISSSGVHTWENVGGVAGTAMTLNSTGLGVGGSPAAGVKLHVGGGNTHIRNAAGGQTKLIFGPSVNSIEMGGIIYDDTDGSVAFGTIQNYATRFITNNTERMRIDSSGNVGVGVTPSYNFHLAGNDPTLAINTTNQSITSVSKLLYRNKDGNGNTYSTAGVYCETAGNGGYGNLVFYSAFNNGLVERLRMDSLGNSIFTPSITPPTLSTNGQLVFNMTSNTNLRFSYRGSDGVTRVANITLA